MLNFNRELKQSLFLYMKFYYVLLIFFLVSCKNDVKSSETTEIETNQTIALSQGDTALEIYDFEGLKPFLRENDDKIHIVNFWATWCAPCVKELPYFEELQANYAKRGVEVLLVSLDFPKQYETKLKPFLKERNLKSKVIVLNDVDSNTWIPLVDEEWSGAIPATLIYKGDNRKFYEGSFTYEELETELEYFLN